MMQGFKAHKTDLVAGTDLEVRFGNAQCLAGSCQAKLLLRDKRLSFAARFAKTRPKEPDIEATGLESFFAQDFLSLLLFEVCSAARAAKGEFSSDFRGRGALPAE